MVVLVKCFRPLYPGRKQLAAASQEYTRRRRALPIPPQHGSTVEVEARRYHVLSTADWSR
jgi:hypothetical protein